ncbi:MAG: ABC transporter permease [Chloroflexi bacterium]|nr:ABC transporter permease [Chloroflexota bacterium]MBV9894593.1 ABC transporter permease [Chloroflexota bacterium]
MATTVTVQDGLRPATVSETALRRPSRSLWSDAWRQFRRHHLAMLGVYVLGFLLLMTLFGPLVYRVPTDAIDYGSGLLGPSLQHPFGTDDLGRDLLARAMLGGRVSMAVGVVAVLIAITLGTVIGAVSGFFGGQVDSALMRVTDLFLALPQLPFLLMVVYMFRDPLKKVLGPEVGIFVLIVGVIGALNWMPLARLVRASFLSVKQKEFVEAARCIGASDNRLMLAHILPNTLSSVIVAATVGVGAAIITESALSFLGVGFPPDMPTWGRLLYDAQNFLDLAPHWAIFPGLLIFLAVLSINYIGDGLRDALDPRKTQ